MKGEIHTTIKASTKKRLLEYGKGVLNEGIETVVEIADRHEVTVNVITVCKFPAKIRRRFRSR